jgi:tripartite-type tricarboxylate transporter receptor subunit TctC
MLSRRRFLSGAAGASFGLAAPSGAAQSYPQRPLKIITAGLPGTPRHCGPCHRGQAIRDSQADGRVETRPGAAGNVGAEFVAKAPADGYTLLMALDTTFTVNPSLYRKPPFDPLADFIFISIAASGSNMLVVHPSIPVNSVAEFVSYAKREPIAYAHGGNGSPGHLCMEYFRLVAGFQTTPVPYRGNPQLVTDLIAGQIKFGFVGTGGVVPAVRSGSTGYEGRQ